MITSEHPGEPGAGPPDDPAKGGALATQMTIWNRAGDLDALGAIIPSGRAEKLAQVLTDADVATLRHLAERGMGDNSLRALMSDLGYIEAWAGIATGCALPWPAPLDLLLKFVAHHLWDADEKARDAAHGMPAPVAIALRANGFLRSQGPHRPATVRRRLSSWATLHRWRDVEGAFAAPALRQALRLATRASQEGRGRKSARAITLDVLRRMLAPLDVIATRRVVKGDVMDHAAVLRALRDRALLSLGFAAGGLRRSELAGLVRGQITWFEDADVPSSPAHSSSSSPSPTPSPGLRLDLGRTKTAAAEDGAFVVVRGRATADLSAWLEAAGIQHGPVFRRIDRRAGIGEGALSGAAVNAIVKARAVQIGIDAAQVSAHGLRSGYLTEAFLQGLSLPEAMAQSRHASVQQAARYFNAAGAGVGRASRMLE